MTRYALIRLPDDEDLNFKMLCRLKAIANKYTAYMYTGPVAEIITEGYAEDLMNVYGIDEIDLYHIWLNADYTIEAYVEEAIKANLGITEEDEIEDDEWDDEDE